ncbi:MAG: sugar transferase [Defluviitaleaceae bacterium]|nr:sugar transferase [Defluviitaleaceae bacterium]MCL2263792.1 sugar transferase [Defluviitaleaceae bacterium]
MYIKENVSRSWWEGFLKRIFDIFCLVISAPLWLPLMVVLAVLVKCTSRGAVFFTQKRFGRDRKFFQIYKFRSMYSNAPKDVPTHLLQDPQAFITPVGKFLRKSSLDELPQVFNILRGELSLVGPRPALWNQIDLIEEREKYGANSVPVGLTGLAQVRGRDELPINVKAAYDGEYAQKIGFLFDMKILFQTVFCALSGRGVQEGGPK